MSAAARGARPGGLKPRPARGARKRRRCLKCGGKFWSSWAGNRICKPCGILNARQTGLGAGMPS